MPGSLSVTVDHIHHFSVPTLSPQQLTAIGGRAVQAIRERVAASRNVHDQPAKAYSSHGPIYIPITGVGTFQRVPAAFADLKSKKGTPEFNAVFPHVKRTKSSLGGREVFTQKDLAKLRSIGVIAPKKSGKSGHASTVLGSVTPSGKSVKFANYAVYKKTLGKTGNRDLQLSGRMLGALGIVEQSDNFVVIGFTRAEEEKKARWNQERDPWFGLSPSDQRAVQEYISTLSFIFPTR